MRLSLSAATLPHFEMLLTHLSETVAGGEHHAKTHRFDPEVLLNARLFPDMWPLSKQVQQVAIFIMRGMSRILDLPVPEDDDVEITFDSLHERIARTIAFLESLDPAAIDAADDRQVTYLLGHGHKHNTLPVWDYLQNVMLPNIHFHTTTAYNILRANGVPLKKEDFTGRV